MPRTLRPARSANVAWVNSSASRCSRSSVPNAGAADASASTARRILPAPSRSRQSTPERHPSHGLRRWSETRAQLFVFPSALGLGRRSVGQGALAAAACKGERMAEYGRHIRVAAWTATHLAGTLFLLFVLAVSVGCALADQDQARNGESWSERSAASGLHSAATRPLSGRLWVWGDDVLGQSSSQMA